MKVIKTKAQIRAEIEQQVENYLDDGGAVDDIAQGVSGHTSDINPYARTTFFSQPVQTRTPVDDIVKALDERKKPKVATPKPKRTPKKKLVFDEFGEPLRWVWEEK